MADSCRPNNPDGGPKGSLPGGVQDLPDAHQPVASSAHQCEAAQGHIAVAVFDACSQQPINGASVQITGPENHSDQTGADGAANFNCLTPGWYTVQTTFAGYNDDNQSVEVTEDTVRQTDVALEKVMQISAASANYTVVLDSSGIAPAAHAILEFQISDGPPGLRYDVQVQRSASSGLTGGPGLANSWEASQGRAIRAGKTVFSSWSNGQRSLRLDGSGNATYAMPLEWWRDLARIPRASFDSFDMHYKVVAFRDGATRPCASSPVSTVSVRNNLERFRVLESGSGRGYISGGTRYSVRMEFTVREPNTTDMYTIVQWMQGHFKIWQGTPPVMTYPTHKLYNIIHDANFPNRTIDRLRTNPRYGDGNYTIDSAGTTAHTTDRPGGALPSSATHMYTTLDFETLLHLNFEVPAAVTIIRQDGSAPVWGVITGVLADPQPITLATDTWDVRILQVRTSSGVTVTHPNTFAGP